MVLFRTTPRVQWHRGPPIPYLSRTETVRSDNDQSALGGRSACSFSDFHLPINHPTTINVRLAAVRRVAYEAADSGLLSPELAAGIRRIKGVRRIGVRVGNWLTAEQGKRLLTAVDRDSLRGKRKYAILAMLIGCGLRRGELLALRVDAIQLRDNCQRGKVGVGNQRPTALPLHGERAQNTPMVFPWLRHLYLRPRQPLIDDLHRRFRPKWMFRRTWISGNRRNPRIECHGSRKTSSPEIKASNHLRAAACWGTALL